MCTTLTALLQQPARRAGGILVLSLLLSGCVSTNYVAAEAGAEVFPSGYKALYQVCIQRHGARTFLLHLHVEPTGAFRMTGLGRLGQTLFEATGGGDAGDRVTLKGAGVPGGPMSRSLVKDFRLAFVTCRSWPEKAGAMPVTRRFGSRSVTVREAGCLKEGEGVVPVTFTVENKARRYRVVVDLSEGKTREGE